MQNRQTWSEHIPDPMVLIFAILVVCGILTHLVPAGEYARTEVNGITHLVPDSFRYIENSGASFIDIFVAIPKGMVEASQYLFIVFIAGGLFHLINSTGALENAVGTMIRKVGYQSHVSIIVITTFVFGFFGATVGFENNIALVPIGAVVGRAIGGGAILGAGMAIGGIGIGFALSPINPYTVGVAQQIAELSLFSGATFRLLLLLVSLVALCIYLVNQNKKLQVENNVDHTNMGKPITDYTIGKKDKRVLFLFVAGMAFMLFGVFSYGWYINEIAGVFLAMAIVIGVSIRMSANEIVEKLMEGASSVTPGALVIGVAAAIKVILDDGQITDTLVRSLSQLIEGMPESISAVLMSVVQGLINFFIPGGSGQALVTMPIMVPLGDNLEISRQVTVLAFQIGDGLTNLIVPTSGGTLAMLAMANVSYSDWLKFIFKYILIVYSISWIFVVLAVVTGY